MTEREPETTDDPVGSDWRSFARRPLLKALGVGATLSMAGTVAAGEQDDSTIDPIYGYSVQDLDEIPGDLQPDHEIALAGAESAPEPGMPVSLFFFDPIGLHVSSGDIVQFTFSSPDHTVTAYHEALGFPTRVPEESPPFSSPIVTVGGAWLYRFDHEGVYDLYCGPHHVLGMVMRVVVGDVAEAEYPEYLETPEGIPPFGEEFEQLLVEFSDETEHVEWVFPTPRQVLTASALDPERIQAEGAVSHSAVLEEIAEPDEAAATVQVREHDEHGDVLVGPDGLTLYAFDQDSRGEAQSTCHDDCAEAWPPLTVEGEPTAGEGVEAELTTFEREDGATQVAAGGWPLYHFARDEQPDDANGQGVNDAWWVVRRDGAPVRPESNG